MSDTAQTAAVASDPDATSPAWEVRGARHADVEAVALAVNALLLELGGTPPPRSSMQEVVRTLIDTPDAGTVLVADADGELVGVLAASWQLAIHAPGAYALIQDLWVHGAWRGQAVGAGLLRKLYELASGRGFARVEVGLPRESFAQFDATEAFYRGNGFEPNGPRMRRVLA
jgi:GNAT superfamily N-acetyltransferase